MTDIINKEVRAAQPDGEGFDGVKAMFERVFHRRCCQELISFCSD